MPTSLIELKNPLPDLDLTPGKKLKFVANYTTFKWKDSRQTLGGKLTLLGLMISFQNSFTAPQRTKFPIKSM